MKNVIDYIKEGGIKTSFPPNFNNKTTSVANDYNDTPTSLPH